MMITTGLLALLASGAINGALGVPTAQANAELDEREVKTVDYFPISSTKDGIVYSTVDHQTSNEKREAEPSQYYAISSNKDGVVYSNVKPQGQVKRSEGKAMTFAVTKDGKGKPAYTDAASFSNELATRDEFDGVEDVLDERDLERRLYPSMRTLSACLWRWYYGQYRGGGHYSTDAVKEALTNCVVEGLATAALTRIWTSDYGYVFPDTPGEFPPRTG